MGDRGHIRSPRGRHGTRYQARCVLSLEKARRVRNSRVLSSANVGRSIDGPQCPNGVTDWPAMSNGVAAEAKDRGVSFRATHPERTFRAVVGIEVRDRSS